MTERQPYRVVARHPGFAAGDLSIDWVEDEWSPAVEAHRAGALKAASWAAAAAPAGATDGAAAPDGKDAGSGWLREGRLQAINRWPR